MNNQIREWEGGAFDPNNIRHFSILPEEDADEGYCVRHDREMKQIDPVVHTDGALFTTTERFSVYSCPQCVEVLARRAGDPRAGVKAYQAALMRVFELWDDGESPDDMFTFLREGTPEDVDPDEYSIE